MKNKSHNRYHVNPETGDLGECDVTIGKCPYRGSTGTENHYQNEADAISAAEKVSEQLAYKEKAVKLRKEQLKEAYALYGSSIKPFYMEFSDDVNHLLNTLREDGFRPLLAGGAVRDAVANSENKNGVKIDSKDLDFEVYLNDNESSQSINPKNVTKKLILSGRRVGNVDEVGKSFGVLKMTLKDGTEIDLSLPRRESKTGTGHTGFDIEPDINMSVEEASARRDFTLNSMMYDNQTHVIIDPHNGMEDLKSGTLRHTSDAFAEDPLRVLRSFQFASRFGLKIDDETVKLSQSLFSEYDTISSERIQVEWDKWATKSVKPSSGLEVLESTGWDKGFSGLSEANTESMRANVDRVAVIAGRDSKLDKRVMLPSAVVANIVDEDEKKQAKKRQEFVNKTVIGVRNQRKVLALANDFSVEDIKTTADAKVAALDSRNSLRERIALSRALNNDPSVDYDAIDNIVSDAGVKDVPESDVMSGNDVMGLSDRKPGPWMKEVISKLRVAQAQEKFASKEDGIKYAKKLLNEI